MSSGILLVDKPAGKTSFSLVHALRKITGVKKIGHAGTLDPLATGVMVMLIGRDYTRKSDQMISHDKEYEATIFLGAATETYDAEGAITERCDTVPSLEEIETALLDFQGTQMQVPPMFSAKKVDGKKLCDLARKGTTIERKAAEVTMRVELIEYRYPHLRLRVECSKGTYIRSLAHDLGLKLGCYGHIIALTRTRSGPYHLNHCHRLDHLDRDVIEKYLIK